MGDISERPTDPGDSPDARTIGQYRIISEIGRGGMGVVYKAKDPVLDRPVAIKLLSPSLAKDDSFARRFIREARAVARLDHPGITQVYQAGRGKGSLYIAMQYLDARPLSSIIAEEGPLQVKYALSIVKQVASALHHAHENGIIHRDIKPSNILVDDQGRARVTDFGLAKQLESSGEKLTNTGNYLGTPDYSSPEQCETAELDRRTDIYSLGVVLYEMLSGDVPFKADTPFKLFEKIIYEEPRPITSHVPGIPREVAKLVNSMMAKNRDDRYPDCAEVVKDIERIEKGEKLTTRRRSRVPRRRPSTSNLRTAAAVVSVAVVAALALWYFNSLSVVSPGPEPLDTTPVEHGVSSPAERRVIVVRDFVNSTGSPSLDWLRVGIADMLITDLSSCDFLEVMGREKAPGTRPDIELTGSYAEAGGRIRVIVQMLDREGGTVIKAVKATGAEDEVFSLIDSLSTEIRSNLETLLSQRLNRSLRFASSGGVASRLVAQAPPAPESLKRSGSFGASGSGAAYRERAKYERSLSLSSARRSADAATAEKKKAGASLQDLLGDKPGLVGGAPPPAPQAPAATAPVTAANAVPAPEADSKMREAALADIDELLAAKTVGDSLPSERSEGAAPAEPEMAVGALVADAGWSADKLEAEQQTNRPLAPRGKSDAAMLRDNAADVPAGAGLADEAAGSSDRSRAVVAQARKAAPGTDGRYEAAESRGRQAAPANPLFRAVKARYTARLILQSDSSDASITRALELLRSARDLAPSLVGIDEEISSLEARLGAE
ncbi:MAG: protein kinase [Planctomycetes bacterium]|nr:protein kinase [Planctomycetota bacterium]